MNDVISVTELQGLLKKYGLPLIDVMQQHQVRLVIKGRRFVIDEPVVHGEKIEVNGKLEPIRNMLKNKWWMRQVSSGKRIIACFDAAY